MGFSTSALVPFWAQWPLSWGCPVHHDVQFSIPGHHPLAVGSSSLLPVVTATQGRCSGSQAETQSSELLVGLTLAYGQGNQESERRRGPQGSHSL